MADKKISELTALTGANVATDDQLVIVDTSAALTKNITIDEFKNALDTATGFVRITGDTMTGALDVQSTITADGLTVDSVDINGATVAWQNSGTNQTYFTTTGSSEQALILRLDNQNLSSTGYFEVQDGSAGRKLLTVEDGGDISFYEDTGTTAKFFWDASAESLGIGTSSPSDLLELSGSTAQPAIRLTDTDVSGLYHRIFTPTNTGLAISADTGNVAADSFVRFDVDGTERMRIDSSGHLLVGTPSPILSAANRGNITLNGTSESIINLGVGGAQGGYLYQTATDLALWNTKNGPLRFATNDTEAMRIDSSGNVGIKVIPKTTNATVTGSLNVNRTGIIVRNNEQVYWSSNIYWDASDQMKSLGSGYGVATAFIPSDGSQRFYTTTASAGSADANLTLDEAMRVTSDGNLLVGKTSVGLSGSGSYFQADGAIVGTRDPYLTTDAVFYANRLVDDGNLFNFYKDGATVGSIGTVDSNSIYIGSDDVYLRMIGVTDDIRPATSTGANRDDAIDLGDANARFKDLYLSGRLTNDGTGGVAVDSGGDVEIIQEGTGRLKAVGGVFIGGAAAGNHLDDYEEGTFTATLGFRVSATGSLNYTRNTFRYIKVGSSVFITGFLTWNQNNITANNGAMQLQGLPFTFANTQLYRGGVNVVYSDAAFSGVTIYQQGFRNEQAETNMIFNFSDTTNGAMDSTIDSYSNIPSSGGMMITGTYTTI